MTLLNELFKRCPHFVEAVKRATTIPGNMIIMTIDAFPEPDLFHKAMTFARDMGVIIELVPKKMDHLAHDLDEEKYEQN